MNKKMILPFLLLWGALPTTSLGKDRGLKIADAFPDENFRTYVKDELDLDVDGYLSDEEIGEVTQIDASGFDIIDLSGIEFFTALEILHCGDNQLAALDVSNNPALKELHCGGNLLTALDVSNNADLEGLYCGGNRLSALDVSNNPALKDLYCGDNQLAALDVSNNPALKELHCSSNQLVALDVSNNPALKDFDCCNNQLAALDVSKNLALELLACDNNQFTELNMSKNAALNDLSCSNNKLASLDVSNCPELLAINYADNPIDYCDLSKNTALRHVSMSPMLDAVVDKDGTRSFDFNGLSKFVSLPGVFDLSKGTDIYAQSYDGDHVTASFDAKTLIASWKKSKNDFESIVWRDYASFKNSDSQPPSIFFFVKPIG